MLFFLPMLFSALGCFFGYKLVKVYSAICGANVGLIFGIYLGSSLGSWFLSIVLGLGLAVCCAVLGYRIHKVGLFLITFFTSTLIAVVLSLYSTLSKLKLTDILNYKGTLTKAAVIGIIVGIIAGTAAVFFAKPFIIIATGLCNGYLTGLFMALMIGFPKLSVLLIPGFIIGGIVFQIKSNHGLLETSGDALRK